MIWVARQQSDIQRLNDEFRGAGPAQTHAGLWVMTRGVLALGPEGVADAVKVVRWFDVFTEDNDPYGTHDFGAFELYGDPLFWKIDCYNRTMDAGSPNDGDPEITCRVLTIMLASEY